MIPKSELARSRFQGLAAAASKRGRIQRIRLLIFAAVLLTGMVFSWLVFDLVDDNAVAKNLLNFQQEASQMDAQLQSQFDLSLEILLMIPPFFVASDDVSREEFGQFVGPALRRHPSIYAIEFLPRVAEADRESFERARRDKEGLEGFKIRAKDAGDKEVPLPPKPFYFPIYYGEPWIRSVLGVDISSHPEQGPYLERACARRNGRHASVVIDGRPGGCVIGDRLQSDPRGVGQSR